MRDKMSRICAVGMGNQGKGQSRLSNKHSGRDGCHHGDLQKRGKSIREKTNVLPHAGQRIRGGMGLSVFFGSTVSCLGTGFSWDSIGTSNCWRKARRGRQVEPKNPK